ncbi:MAG TPA: TolC family protein [Azospirillum sp.]|nr:TolC family protein [Azospirillum sp.]
MSRIAAHRRRPFLAVLIGLALTASPATGQGLQPNRAYAPAGVPPVPAAAEGKAVKLTLPEAVYLGLRQNRQIRSAYLQRVVDKYNLLLAENEFRPQGSIVAGYSVQRTGSLKVPPDMVASGGGGGATGNTFRSSATVTPTVTLKSPIGTTLGLTWGNSQTGARGTVPGQRGGGQTLTLSVIQPLLRGAGYDAATAGLRIARIQERAAQVQLKARVADTVTQIVGAYHQFIAAQQRVGIARAAVKRAYDLQATNQALIQAGRMAESELVQSQSTVASQELARISAENAFDSARLQLVTLLALDPHTRIEPADTLTAQPVRIDFEAVRAIAFDSRPDHLGQLLSIETARIAQAQAENQRLWDLSATGSVSVPTSGRSEREALELMGRSRTNLGAGLQLVIPLNDLPQRQAVVSATTQLRQSELQLEQLRAQIEQDVRDAVRNVDTLWRQYKLAKQAHELTVKKLEIENAKLRAGRTTNFQVVSFQNELRQAEVTELEAMISYLNALVALDQRLGTTLDTWQIQLNDPEAP